MTEEPKGPPKIDLEEILSGAEEGDSGLGADAVEVVGLPTSEGAPAPAEVEDAPVPADETADTDVEERILRLRADFDNYRKRVEREKADYGRRAAGELVRELLPVLDNLERALEEQSGGEDSAFRQGVELIHRQAMEVLTRAGLQPVDSMGKPFDPNTQEAVDREATPDVPDGTVIGELQKGYLYQGQLLRPAMVRVSYRPEEAQSASEDGREE